MIYTVVILLFFRGHSHLLYMYKNELFIQLFYFLTSISHLILWNFNFIYSLDKNLKKKKQKYTISQKRKVWPYFILNTAVYLIA